MFISPAYAQAAKGGLGGLESLLPLILIFVVFYFLLIRPQQKKQKQHREMLAALRRGDRVVTAGGVIGTITRVGENELTVEISEGVRVRVMRGMVSDVLAKHEPDDDEEDEAEEAPAEKPAEAEAKEAKNG
jgi:preprotein translocase subunit YajC